MIDLGKLDERIGNEMKYKWNNIISFYPAFQKIMYQYEHIRQNGGVFIYDTGYAYLFGKKYNHFLLDFLLLSCCMVFKMIRTHGTSYPLLLKENNRLLIGKFRFAVFAQ